MILEQNFSEADLAELEQVFSATMNRGYFRIISEGRYGEIRKGIKDVCVFILFGCCVMLIVLEGRISARTMFFMTGGAIALLAEPLWKKSDEKMKLANIIKRAYGKPFSVGMEEDRLIYRKIEFPYAGIRCVVDYKNFLFARAGRRLLIIKADAEEKEAILSKMKENEAIRYVRQEEPFDLKQFR